MNEPLVPLPPRRPSAPYWRGGASTLYVGDARDVLAGMPDESADCIVTSPPYWGKRDYGMARQYGREPSPGRLRPHAAGDVHRGPPRPGRRRHVLAQPG